MNLRALLVWIVCLSLPVTAWSGEKVSASDSLTLGPAEAVVKGKPEKQAKQIENAVAKIGKKFDSMYRKGK